MKIATSLAVLTESHRVGAEVAALIAPGVQLPSLEDSIKSSQQLYNQLKHFSYVVQEDGSVELEISDDVILAILRLYGKFANALGIVVGVVKSLLPTLKADVKTTEALANEPRE